MKGRIKKEIVVKTEKKLGEKRYILAYSTNPDYFKRKQN